MALTGKVLVLRNEGMGEGNPALGQTILASFLRLVAQGHDRPKAIFLYNSGVKLLAEETPVLAHLKELADLGIPVQACTTCVDFYGLRERIQVGELSTMAQFVEYVTQGEVLSL